MFCRLLFLLVFTLISAASYSNQQHLNNEQEFLISLLQDDKFIGNINAPIIMVEYASLSCYHCSLFHKNVFPKLKELYIDTGKMLYIFRHFPLDYLALKAAMLSHCYEKQEDYFAFNKAVFYSIDLWNYNASDLTILENITKVSNMSKLTFNQCIDNEKNMNKIIEIKSIAIEKLSVSATPVFFIKHNTKQGHNKDKNIKHEGYHKIEYFIKIIDNLYKKATIK